MGYPETVTVPLERNICKKCGGVYALSADFLQHKREKGGDWSCPYCRTYWHFTETEVARLQKAIEAEKRRTEFYANNARIAREDAEHSERRRRATVGQMTRLKNRIGNGVCPCCNRTFKNLRRHMVSQHPEFIREGKVNGG